MSHTFNTAHDIAHALATQHAAMLAGEASPHAQAVHASDAQLSPEMAGVLQGCRMLGFLEHDAQCVAHAWQAQTQRTGQFSVNDWPCSPQDFGVAPTPRAKAFAACPQHLGLYAVL
ncbi:MAG: thiamine phosphate synthase, partial [Limnohabitans sp.]